VKLLDPASTARAVAALAALTATPAFADTSRAAQETTMTGGLTMLIVYLLLLALLFGFFVVVLRKQGDLSGQLDELERRVDDLAARDEG